mmetsp:Transcript_69810/g.211202  ORF Transcript_69810/g.211202 Transcript_69810/m.211202 type:complete len:86 (+) Transcript_69810:491-748(+)
MATMDGADIRVAGVATMDVDAGRAVVDTGWAAGAAGSDTEDGCAIATERDEAAAGTAAGAAYVAVGAAYVEAAAAGAAYVAAGAA